MDEKRSGSPRRRRAATSPHLEHLEGRRLMAANALTAGIKEVASNGVMALVVTGTNKADVVHISDNGTGAAGNISVTLGNGPTYVSKSAVETVAVFGKGGNDQVTYTLAGTLVVPRTVQVDLGDGNDQFHANLVGAIDNATGLDLEAYGDAGNDTMSIDQTGPVLAGSVIPYLEGGAGNDTLTYRGTGAVAAGASLLPGLSGGAGNDTITSNYSGIIAGNYIYNLTVDGGAGNDVISDDIRALAGSTGTIGTGATTPAAVMGGAGNDRIHFAIHADPGVTLAGANAVAIGGAGKDTVERTANVQGDPTNEKDSVLS